MHSTRYGRQRHLRIRNNIKMNLNLSIESRDHEPAGWVWEQAAVHVWPLEGELATKSCGLVASTCRGLPNCTPGGATQLIRLGALCAARGNLQKSTKLFPAPTNQLTTGFWQPSSLRLAFGPRGVRSATGQKKSKLQLLRNINLDQSRGHLYLLGLLAMIKCSICSYQCDN